MINISSINRTEICNICGSREFTVLARRSDNLEVLVCQHCGMGVLELIPTDTAIFYGDSYYENSESNIVAGYSDYDTNAEQGVLWASELLKLIKGDGRVLDVGCANGFLINSLSNGYETYGIEANDKAAKLAESKGAKIISKDILDPTLLFNYSSYFDAITAIAVFEHITDFKGSIEASLKMLKPNGILIFEVPLVSENNDNDTWFKTSLEHIFYPTIKGLRYLFDVQLKTPMIGSELIIRDYASTFVGMATPDDSTFTSLKVLYDRLLFTAPTNISREERRAQLLLKVIHAADPKPEHLSFIKELFPSHQQTPFISRCLDLWRADSVRLQSAENYLIEVEAAKEWHSKRAERAIEAYDHIQLERDQLQAEMSTLAYQATKKVRHVLHTRLPWAYRFAGRLLYFAHRVWRFRATDSFLKLRTKLFDTRTVVNAPWPKDKPLMSIIIPCFNYGKYLNEAIDSVLNQTFQDFEIIVVDDESTDPYTQEVLASLDKPKTRLIQQKNQRVSMARNNGIREARGKYVCCLDADDLLTPTYLEKCLYWLETEHLDICYSWVQLFGDSNFLWHTSPFSIDDLMQGNIVSTTAVFRKSLWEKTDGYKQQMRHGYEDWEFWLTMARHGARGHRIPEPLFLYRKHGPSLTTQTDPVHDKLCTDIQVLHADIYGNPGFLSEAKRRQFRNYIVKNPLINLLRHPDSQSPTRNPMTLNILLSVPWFDLGGSSVLMKEVFSQLVTTGVRATAVATNPSGEIQADEGLSLYESFTSDCFNLPSFLGNKEAIAFVEYLVTSRKIDILFLVGSRLVYESLPRLKTLFPDLKVVDQLYNTVGHVKSNREFSRYIDLNLVANEEVRDCLIELGETAERIQVIPHGINTAVFSPTDCHYLAQLARRTERQFTFGFMGRLSSEKRPQDIVQLAAKLPECHFRIRGEGPMEDMLRKQVLAQGLADRVHFDARFENPIEFFAGLDALLVPSEIEGLPLVLLEAMALELPVIATKVGHIPMAISDGENGFLYESGDMVHLCEIAQRLTQLLPNERKKIGKQARQTILEGYTIAKCASSYFDAFNRLLA